MKHVGFLVLLAALVCSCASRSGSSESAQPSNPSVDQLIVGLNNLGESVFAIPEEMQTKQALVGEYGLGKVRSTRLILYPDSSYLFMGARRVYHKGMWEFSDGLIKLTLNPDCRGAIWDLTYLPYLKDKSTKLHLAGLRESFLKYIQNARLQQGQRFSLVGRERTRECPVDFAAEKAEFMKRRVPTQVKYRAAQKKALGWIQLPSSQLHAKLRAAGAVFSPVSAEGLAGHYEQQVLLAGNPKLDLFADYTFIRTSPTCLGNSWTRGTWMTENGLVVLSYPKRKRYMLPHTGDDPNQIKLADLSLQLSTFFLYDKKELLFSSFAQDQHYTEQISQAAKVMIEEKISAYEERLKADRIRMEQNQ
ncbi:hypothetical protein BVY04_03625 [bacterium M21]|nr:hypothetical protein BVY04_03625 [bacterium M21]